MLREMISGEAEWTDPDQGVEIDAGKGVEDGGARWFAAEWSVGKNNEIWRRSDRRKGCGDRDDAF